MTHDSERRTSDAGRTTTERAADQAEAAVRQLRDRARDLARDASDRVERLTGQSVDSWVGKLRKAVREHPMRALALTIGLGYVLGKRMRRG